MIAGCHLLGDPAGNNADDQHPEKTDTRRRKLLFHGTPLISERSTSHPTDLRPTRKVVLAHHVKAVHDQRQQNGRENHGKDEAGDVGHLRSAFEVAYRSPIWGASAWEGPAERRTLTESALT